MDNKKPVITEKSGNQESFTSLLFSDPYYLLALLVTIVGIILSTAIILWKRVKIARRSVLLMGLCDSGKTLIFARLTHGKFVNTLTSTKENTAELPVRAKSVKLVDIPGHERLRYRFFEQFKTTARGIVFVVDSVTFSKDLRDVAEFLYTILTDSCVQANRVPIIIACNKQDETMTKSANVIQASIIKEINVLRVTKSNQLAATTVESEGVKFLGRVNHDFEFAQLKNPVEFGETSAMQNDKTADLEAIEDWLVKIA